MKNVFKGYYNIDSDELSKVWSDEKTLFVFDTNVFLNLYGYAKQTRDDFFKIINALNERIWIPYHVGLEYQRRRLDVIKNEKAVFNQIEKNLEKIQSVFKGDFEQLALKRRFPSLFESTEKLEKEIGRSISIYKRSVKRWNDNQPCVRSNDEIRGMLDLYFDKKIGTPPKDQAWLDETHKEGQLRYDNIIPPGFKDAAKSKQDSSYFQHNGLKYEKQFGDYIIWKQLLEKARCDKIKSVIFITDDNKDDWWLNIDSNGKKQIGPLPELQAEIYRETNVSSFHMYTTAMFLEDGKLNLSVDIKDSSIKDAINIAPIGDETNINSWKHVLDEYVTSLKNNCTRDDHINYLTIEKDNKHKEASSENYFDGLVLTYDQLLQAREHLIQNDESNKKIKNIYDRWMKLNKNTKEALSEKMDLEDIDWDEIAKTLKNKKYK